jgi:hypothetical protein
MTHASKHYIARSLTIDPMVELDVDGYIHKDTRITCFEIEKSLSSCVLKFSDKYGQLFPLCSSCLAFGSSTQYTLQLAVAWTLIFMAQKIILRKIVRCDKWALIFYLLDISLLSVTSSALAWELNSHI